MKAKQGSISPDFRDLPSFENEDQEREFWATHDATEYVDWNEAQAMVC